MNRQQMNALACGLQASATDPLHKAWVEQPGLATRLIEVIRRLGEVERSRSWQRATLADQELVQHRDALRQSYAPRQHQLRDVGVNGNPIDDLVGDAQRLVHVQQGGVR